jgi:AcrR family transcriptional regulator
MTNPDPGNSSRIRLVEAAILCFAEKGFDATGIREIAQKAQANSAMVQYHFGGKTGLYAAALRHIFSRRPVQVPSPPEDAGQPDARRRAIQALGDMIQSLLNELMACSEGSELDKASLVLVTRELQEPRESMAPLILEHLRPYTDHMRACLRILRPDLDRLSAMDYCSSIYGQVVHLQHHLALIRLLRDEPDFPRDLQVVARHITEFSLRGIGVPEAFPGA